MRRLPSLVLPGIALAALVAGPVAAAAPTRAFAPALSYTDSSCGFPVELSFPIQKEYAMTFVDQDGNVTKVIISGQIFATLTNLTNGNSLTINASGPGVFNFGTGSLLLLGEGVGPLDGAIVSGRGQIDLASGVVHGTSIDLCPLLA